MAELQRISVHLVVLSSFLLLALDQLHPADAVCRVVRHEYDCNSCVESNIHHPMQNLAPFGPEIPNITGFNYTECNHMLAACRVDGTGAQMQAKVTAWAYAQLTGRSYVHVPVSHLDHFGHNEQSRITTAIENFFNLGFGEMNLTTAARSGIQPCSVLSCFSFFDDYDGLECWDLVKAKLLRKYWSSYKPRTLFLHDHEEAARHPDTRTLAIAIHIRRGDVNLFKATDGDRFNSNEFYIDVLRRIQKSLPPLLANDTLLDVVVLSEGEPADFASLVQAFPTTRLFLGTDLIRSLHTLVTADIMIMARSSLSYAAAIYNDGIVVYDPYWHKLQPGWVLNDKDDESVLINALNTPANHNRIINHMRARQAPNVKRA